LKTKIRRLYDITNVFKAIGLVKKTITSDKKVAIEWLGLAGFEKFTLEQQHLSNLNTKSTSLLSEKKFLSAFNVIAPVPSTLENKRPSCHLMNQAYEN